MITGRSRTITAGRSCTTTPGSPMPTSTCRLGAGTWASIDTPARGATTTPAAGATTTAAGATNSARAPIQPTGASTVITGRSYTSGW